MKQEYAEQLLRTFPQLYRAKEDASFRAPLMFGFEIYDGWFELIWGLSESLDQLAKQEGRTKEDWPAVVQVKEKFGGLRFYAQGISSPMREFIDETEKASFRTCEDCGAPVQTYRADGWILTRCELCAARIRKEESPKLWEKFDSRP